MIFSRYNFNFKNIITTATVAAFVLLTACNVTRSVPDGQYLLNKADIRIDKRSLKSGLKPIIKQKPNRRILGVSRFYLSVYTMADRGKETKFKKWLKKTVGEPPVIYDPILTKKSSLQLKIYLENVGYFNSVVTDTVVLSNKKAHVIYTVKTDVPYKIDSIRYNIHDAAIGRIITADAPFRLFKTGEIFNGNVLGQERDRITKILNDSGYFKFRSEYIRFWIDSAFKNHTVNVRLDIENPEIREIDTNKTDMYHQKYYINNIFINSTFRMINLDSTYVEDTIHMNEFYFIAGRNLKTVRPEILMQQIFFKKGEIYQRNNHEFTYQRLQDLTVFRYVNIDYQEAGTDSLGHKLLDCYINLSPGKNQDYSVENELTNNGGALGIAGNIAYRNRNTFSGAELMEIKLKASAEALTNFISDSASNDKQFLFFNTYEIGPELSFRFPRFLMPLKILNEPKRYNPGTLINANLLYEFNPDYKRITTNANFGYTWKSKKFFRHFVYPVEFNYFNVSVSDAFQESIIEQGNLALVNSFRDHMIANARYTVLFNSQNVRKPGSFFFIRNNIEISGNLFYAYDKATDNSKDEITNVYTKLGVPYSQYVKEEMDIRYYQVFNKSSQLVYRIYGGLGIAYGNSDVEGGAILPFEKSFFTGGANDLRAYRSRTVGPGSYVTDQNYEKFGDIKLNGNIEYRFDIVKILQGAIFFDAGNVWFRSDVAGYDGGTFHGNSFYKEIASGAGLGARFNFTFFIMRLDAALPVTNPSKPIGNRYVLNNSQWSDINLNFGIGYPF